MWQNPWSNCLYVPQIWWKYNIAVTRFLTIKSLHIFACMTQQLSCRVMCKILQQSPLLCGRKRKIKYPWLAIGRKIINKRGCRSICKIDLSEGTKDVTVMWRSILIVVDDALAIDRVSFRLNTLRPKQSGCHFEEDIFKCILCHENCCILNQNLFSKPPINYKSTIVQIMEMRQLGDKPLFETMMAYFTDIYMHHPESTYYVSCLVQVYQHLRKLIRHNNINWLLVDRSSLFLSNIAVQNTWQKQ